MVHASPGVRRFARELGVPIGQVTGTGPKGRISKEDIQGFVKQSFAGGGPAQARGGMGDLGLPPWPKVDFAKYGPIEAQALTRIPSVNPYYDPSSLGEAAVAAWLEQWSRMSLANRPRLQQHSHSCHWVAERRRL